MIAAAVLASLLVAGRRTVAAQDPVLPNRRDSVKFAAIGDNGTGDRPEYDVAGEMNAARRRFPFEFVIMLGDNLYGSQNPADFVRKFERPFKPLLDAGVKFFACLGNHDNIANDVYPLFNMGGQRYYTFVRNDVRFVVLDSSVLDPLQIRWLDATLSGAQEPWKVVYLHHPLYSDGRRHGGSVDLRVALEPIFVRSGVSVVYSGHDHIYERFKPQQGIVYFVSGAGGQLRTGDLHGSDQMAAGFDREQSFMLNEIAGDDLYFQVISRTGATVDHGTIHRRAP